MRAALIGEVGGTPEVHDDVPFTDATQGQLVVAVRASAVNPIDVAIAAGQLPLPPTPLPFVPGREGVGVVVNGPMRGRRVWFEARGGLGGHGAMAQRAVTAHPAVVEVPDEIGDADAVGGIAGIAAWLALTWRGALLPGESVLVLAATGNVGRIAVQAARALGASRVVAAARSSLDAAGADAFVALDTDDPDELRERFRAATGSGVDLVIDPLWGSAGAAALAALRDGGRLVQMGSSAAPSALVTGFDLRAQTFSPAGIVGRNLSILGHTNMAAPPRLRAKAYADLLALVAHGEVVLPTVVHPLRDVAAAFAERAAGAHHKVVVEIGE